MTKDEALRMAIEALSWYDEREQIQDVINICKEALEQPTQEHSMTYEDGFTHGYDAHLADYKEQPTQEPLTHVIGLDNDGKEVVVKLQTPLYTTPTSQEPVAWMHCVDEDITEFNDFQACPKCEPLYTHPKEWQGLSDDEIDHISMHSIVGSFNTRLFARAIEAKLKEKNNG
jgi:hypothetical protein